LTDLAALMPGRDVHEPAACAIAICAPSAALQPDRLAERRQRARVAIEPRA